MTICNVTLIAERGRIHTLRRKEQVARRIVEHVLSL